MSDTLGRHTARSPVRRHRDRISPTFGNGTGRGSAEPRGARGTTVRTEPRRQRNHGSPSPAHGSDCRGPAPRHHRPVVPKCRTHRGDTPRAGRQDGGKKGSVRHLGTVRGSRASRASGNPATQTTRAWRRPTRRAASGNSSTVVAPAATRAEASPSLIRSLPTAMFVTATIIGRPVAANSAS